RVEVRLHGACRWMALARHLGERTHHDAFELDRILGAYFARSGVVTIRDQPHRFVIGLALEQATARRDFEEHDSEREDVAPRIDTLTPGLLGRHVARLTSRLARFTRFPAVSEPEVDDLHFAAERHEHVGW